MQRVSQPRTWWIHELGLPEVHSADDKSVSSIGLHSGCPMSLLAALEEALLTATSWLRGTLLCLESHETQHSGKP